MPGHYGKDKKKKPKPKSKTAAKGSRKSYVSGMTGSKKKPR